MLLAMLDTPAVASKAMIKVVPIPITPMAITQATVPTALIFIYFVLRVLL